ncbi:MAG: nucleotidyltransferase domain-containing protein [Desulfobacteraceae bacterium]|nr:MAG: nucleotidyltransferase domain-containing protein [Desulfobacteraceae bacterium]
MNPMNPKNPTNPEPPDHVLEKEIVRTFLPVNPQKIILFGSYARGDADQYSDIDIIIVYSTKKRFLDRLAELYAKWEIKRPADILAYTPEEFDSMLKDSSFLEEAVGTGRIIYENA